jgi:hypothetical protein
MSDSTFVVAAIFKNETTNLKEWLDHYIWQGASHFYLGNNESTDEPMKLLQPYIDAEWISFFDISGNGKQFEFNRFITSCIQEKQGPIPDWILIADIDEFWFGREKKMVEVLAEYPESTHVVYTQWHEFGPSADGFQPQSLRKELLYRNPKNTSPKFCFRTRQIPFSCVWIHEIRNYPAEHMITEHDKLHCNHYYCQSLEYWNSVKIPRGYVNGDMSVYGRPGEFEERAAPCIMYDDLLAKQVEALEEGSGIIIENVPSPFA